MFESISIPEVLDALGKFFESLGWERGLFILFFIFCIWYFIHLHRKAIQSKQQEINRMAESIKDIREDNRNLRNDLRECIKNSRP